MVGTGRCGRPPAPAKSEPHGGYKIALSQSSFRTERGSTIRSTFSVAWSGAVPNDLQTKLEKYERKAAHYEKAAQQASEGPQRAFYQGLALYCDELAAKFREVIAKRSGASLAAE